MKRCQLLFCLIGMAQVAYAAAADDNHFRVVVEVPPATEMGRDDDEMVASVEIDLPRLIPDAANDRRIDLKSLQVVREGETRFPKHAQQNSAAGRPFRFYDHSLLDEFPTWRRYASLEGLAGRPLFEMKEKLPFGHRVFASVGDHVRGTLVWPHTQSGKMPSTYVITFDLAPRSQPANTPPAGWIGDGGNRIAPTTPIAGPPGNNSATVVDWNGDGLSDLLYGISSGYLVVAENTGTRRQPAFDRRKILYDATGKPIDAGYDSCPLAVDWNGDGARDLLVGAEKGCILFFENRGSTAEPAFVFRDFVKADGKMLLTPNWPIAELKKGKRGEVFPADYLAIPSVCDWDGDGDVDLLAGGFVTGWIFLFENTGRRGSDGIPELTARGPLQADGRTIDTGWAAAPQAVDLDADGDLDLICGAKPITPEGGDLNDRTANLLYFENTGDATNPRLEKRPFPANGLPPVGGTLMAPVCDWNGDAVSDLFLVVRSMQLFAVPNIGTRQKPRFDMKRRAIAASWSHQQIPAGTFVDWNNDGHPDLINRFQVTLNDGTGFPHSFSERINMLAGQKPIRHPNPYGDENSYVTLYDFDGDGDHDCIYGAHSGHIWFHENRGNDDKPQLDHDGYRLPLAGGRLVQVGEAPADKNKDSFNFTDLQGARPKPAPADFDGDGRVDLVIGDTYGRVRFFRNEGRDERGRHHFAQPTTIHESRSRLSIHAADWNGDNAPDVFVITGQRVAVFLNKAIPGRCEFDEPKTLALPPTIGGFYGVAPVDLNGDGDTDLVYHTSSRITCWVERSFLEHGYRRATIVSCGVVNAR